MNQTSERAQLTVVIAVWDDYVKYLPQALESVAAQQVAARVIVVDNASTVPIEVPSHVGVVRLNARMHIDIARNAGLQAVKTRFVCMADADDEFLPGFFEMAMRRLHTSGQVGWAGRYQHVNAASGKPTGQSWPTGHWPYLAQMYPPVLAFGALVRNCIPIGGAIYRTDAVRRAGSFPTDAPVAGDWALGVALATQGRIVMSRKPVVKYRVHNDSVSRRPRPFEDRARAAAVVRRRYVEAVGRRPWSPITMAFVERLQLHRLRKDA